MFPNAHSAFKVSGNVTFTKRAGTTNVFDSDITLTGYDNATITYPWAATPEAGNTVATANNPYYKTLPVYDPATHKTRNLSNSSPLTTYQRYQPVDGDVQNMLLESVSTNSATSSVTIRLKTLAPSKATTTTGYMVPRAGEILLDLADANRTDLVGILIHEIGHVLGLVGINGWYRDDWDTTGWTGEYAVAEYKKWKELSVTKVPIAAGGGHFDEGSLGNELMTPIHTTDGLVLSRVTAAALEDMGYRINYNSSHISNTDIIKFSDSHGTGTGTDEALGLTGALTAQARVCCLSPDGSNAEINDREPYAKKE